MTDLLSTIDAAIVQQATKALWPPGPDFRTDAARVVRTAIGADVVTFNRLDMGSGVRDVVIDPPEWGARMRAFGPVAERLAHQHPLVEYFLDSEHLGAVRISDQVRRDEWIRTAFYAEYYRPLGFQDQMVLPVPSADHFINVVAVNRADGDFTSRDASVLEAFLPTLVLGCGGVHEESLQVGTAAGWYVVRMQGGRRVTRVAPRDPGRVMVEGAVLPTGGSPVAADGLGRMQRVSVSGEPWLIRRISGTDEEALVVAQRVSEASVHMLGLTPRQLEVLRLLADGATNGQIAKALSIAEGTARKHVERILDVLDAPNRAAAVGRFRDRW